VSVEFFASFEEGEFDDAGDFDDFGAEFFDEFYGGGHGAAGGEEVVDHDDAVAFVERVDVHFERVGAVFEFVGFGDDGVGEFPFFAYEGEGEAEGIGERAGEDESACVGADDGVDLHVLVAVAPFVDDVFECGAVLEECGDVFELDAGFRKVGDRPDERGYIHFLGVSEWVGQAAD